MPKTPKPILHAAVAVIERGGKILICQRRHDDSFGGLWEFPGGKRELRESWEACVQREVLEEVGVTLRRLKPYGWMRQAFADGTVIFKVFHCGIEAGEPQPLDSQAVRWVNPSELPRYQFPPANKAMIARLAKRRASSGARQHRVV